MFITSRYVTLTLLLFVFSLDTASNWLEERTCLFLAPHCTHLTCLSRGLGGKDPAPDLKDRDWCESYRYSRSWRSICFDI